MRKVLETICISLSLVGGLIVNLLGGWDALLETLIILTILDYVTGIIKGVYLKQLSSAIGLKGIIKKCIMYILLAAVVAIEKVVNMDDAFRKVLLMFYISNEGISLVENVGKFIPIPKQIKTLFYGLKDAEKTEK